MSMGQSRSAVCLLSILAILATLQQADAQAETQCFVSTVESAPPPSGTVTYALIYVTFPSVSGGSQPDPAFPSILDADRTSTLPARLSSFFDQQSEGDLDLQFDVVEVPGDPNAMWLADHPNTVYTDPAQVVALSPNNADCYRGTPGSEPPNSRSYTDGELPAEILRKIESAYGASNPVAAADHAAIIYAAEAFAPIGTGNPGGWSKLGHCEQCGGSCSGLPASTRGLAIEWGSATSVATAVELFAHELGHQLLTLSYLNDSLTQSQHTIGDWTGMGEIEERYNYGNLSLMRASYVPNEGALPIILPELIKLGWKDAPIIVEESLKAHRLHDIRSAGGQALMVPLTTDSYTVVIAPGFSVDVQDRQGFWMSYHSGYDKFGQPNEDGAPSAQHPNESIYRSKGVMVWHVLEKRLFQNGEYSGMYVDFMDLESGDGRVSEPWNPPASAPEPVLGFDPYDRWPEPHVQQQNYWPGYHGSVDDFYGSTGPAQAEFSYRTNPSSFGQLGLEYSVQQQTPGSVVDPSRRAPQSVPSSIFLQVRDEGVELDGTPYAELDILLAPHEDIMAPNGGEVFGVNSSVEVRWGSERSFGWDPSGNWGVDQIQVIDVVDIYLSLDGGNTYPVQLASEIPNTGSFDWLVDASHLSDQAMIKIVYHNIFTQGLGEDASDGVFSTAQPKAVLENRSAETQLTYGGMPYSSISFDADGDGDDDLMIANRSAFSTLHLHFDTVGGVPQFVTAGSGTWESGAEPQPGLHGLAAADYDNDGDVDFFASAMVEPRLYRNDGGNFVDVAPELGITALATDSWSAAWQDYDSDGFLDLFVGRGLCLNPEPTPSNTSARQNLLLRSSPNAQQEILTFQDVSASAGVDQVVEQQDFTGGVAWGDFDGDGDPDIFASRLIDNLTAGPPGGPNHGSHLYVNQGDGTFLEESDLRLPENIVWNSSATWVDIDNDADLDLVASGQADGYVGTRIYRNDGSGFSFVSEELALSERIAITGVHALDFDLDGNMDLLSLPVDQATKPRLYLTNPDVAWPSLYDAGASVGLAAAATSGALVRDWNGDGDPDLYLGRSDDGASSKFFYRNVDLSGGDSPTNQWTGVRLTGAAGNNVSAIGARVVLKKDGVPFQVQAVDGGSGRGGQLPGELLFGLGDNSGSPTLEAEVHWPNGFVQTQTLTANMMNGISDMTPATVDEGSITVTRTPMPGSKVEWKFEWDTPYMTRIAADVVIVQDMTCSSSNWSFDLSDANVTSAISKTATGYHHVVTVSNMDCIPGCSYQYTVQSATDVLSDVSSTHTFKTKVCLQ